MKTSTPYTVSDYLDDGRIGIVNNDNLIVVGLNAHTSKDDANFIVKACNNHDSLVAALESITNVVGHNSCTDGKTPNGFVIALDKARAALAKLEAK
jgi:hypothetical protein